jgi:phosphoribosyl-ATP pyrophosphohydrolase/phosphoribosyl-AMP cyclohydrolase
VIIPSIDLQGGSAVQLVGGAEKALDAGDPRPLARRFGRVGEIAVIDLDAALGQGSNQGVIEDLLDVAPCRVGGGIRSAEAAIRWLDSGARKVILGTAARPDVLERLPKPRVIAALDARDGEVVVEGWTSRTGRAVLERIAELKDLVGGFLVTFVEREGRLGGTDLEFAKVIRAAAGDLPVTIAGGITTAEEIAELDRLRLDAQVGMALYTGRLPLAQAFAAPLRTDRPDGLWPTIVADAEGVALGLCYSDLESLSHALENGVGAYHSRQRGLWVKGATSGATQALLKVDLDCDRDALRFTVRQEPPGFCHLGTHGCFGPGDGIGALARRLRERAETAPAGSYTARLLRDPNLLAAKLREEADELGRARTREEVVHEAADVLYFTLTRLAQEGIGLDEVARTLDRRALKVTRRD